MKKIQILSFVFIAFLAIVGKVNAYIPTLTLSSSNGDIVNINVNGDANSNVTLYYNNNSSMQSKYLGSTNNYGSLGTTINASSYGINQNSLVYVIVNNQQSSSVSWPYYSNNNNNYTNNVGLNISNISLSVGNSITLTSTVGGGIYVSNNSNPNIASTNMSTMNFGCSGINQYNTLTGQPCYMYNNNNYNNYNYNNISNEIMIYGLSNGVNTITICQNNNSNNCSTVNVNVVSGGSVLGASTTNFTTCNLYRNLWIGKVGSDVTCLKSQLAALGYLSYEDSYGTYFNQATKNAVIQLQRDNGIRANGYVGTSTRALLN